MPIAIDIILAVIIIIPIIFGIKRGFVKTVMGLESVLLAILAAYMLMPYISQVCREKIVDPYLSGPVRSRVESMLANSNETLGIESLNKLTEIPEVLEDIFNTFGISTDDIRSYIAEEENGEQADASSEISKPQNLTDYIVNAVLSKTADIISFVIIFIAAILVLRIVTFVLCTIFKMPLLNGINKIAGAVFGLCCGGVAAFVFAKLLIALLPTLASVKPEIFGGMAEQSVILKFIGNI